MTPQPPGATLSIVIPVGPGDRSWEGLLPGLVPQCAAGTEIVLSGAEAEPASLAGSRAMASGLEIRWLTGPAGRAGQLNRGAALATGRFLWFLHADSRLAGPTVSALVELLESAPESLWYFDLRFLPDGPRLTALNAVGTRIRSRLLGLPFGDQGFALARAQFDALGRFPESAEYGEDHLLIWAARRAGVAVHPTGMPLFTSARKYSRDGWLRTTLRHLRLTWKQAAAEWRRSAGDRGGRA